MNQRRIDLLTLSVLLPLMLIFNQCEASICDGSLQDFQIEVDSNSKSVNEGEKAIFIWNVSNDSPLLTYEFTVSCDYSEFSQYNFVLRRGERISITQSIDPSTNPTPSSSYVVNWHVVEKAGQFVILNTYMITGALEVIIINSSTSELSNNTSNGESGELHNDHLSYYALLIIISIIVIVVIIKKRKK